MPESDPQKDWRVDCRRGKQEEDELHPKYGSGIVAKEMKIDNRPELFAATPPLEFIKCLILRCASRQTRARPSRLMIQDISPAGMVGTREVAAWHT